MVEADRLPEQLATLKEVFLLNRFTRPEAEGIIASHGKRKPDHSDDGIVKGVGVLP